MADLDITLKRKVGAAYDVLYPTTTWTQVESKPTTFTPTSHTHGVISNVGVISASTVAVASGDALLMTDVSNSNTIQKSAVVFGTGTTTFLRNDGAWATPAGGGTVTGTGTTNLLTYWTGTSSIGSLATSTYPSLTELSYVKGVTSALQTQLNGKAATSHTHGNIQNNGIITAAPVAIENGDTILIANNNNSQLIERGVAFGTSTTTFLRNDGAWATPDFISTHITSDSTRFTSTYATDFQITSLEANSYYEVVFIGTFYKTSTNSAAFRFSFVTSNTTGTPTLFGLAEAATSTSTGRTDQNITAVGTTIVSGSVFGTSSETGTYTGRNVMFNGLLYTGTSTKDLSLQTATSTTLTNGTVGLRAGSMLKVRKIN